MKYYIFLFLLSIYSCNNKREVQLSENKKSEIEPKKHKVFYYAPHKNTWQKLNINSLGWFSTYCDTNLKNINVFRAVVPSAQQQIIIHKISDDDLELGDKIFNQSLKSKDTTLFCGSKNIIWIYFNKWFALPNILYENIVLEHLYYNKIRNNEFLLLIWHNYKAFGTTIRVRDVFLVDVTKTKKIWYKQLSVLPYPQKTNLSELFGDFNEDGEMDILTYKPIFED